MLSFLTPSLAPGQKIVFQHGGQQKLGWMGWWMGGFLLGIRAFQTLLSCSSPPPSFTGAAAAGFGWEQKAGVPTTGRLGGCKAEEPRGPGRLDTTWRSPGEVLKARDPLRSEHSCGSP